MALRAPWRHSLEGAAAKQVGDGVTTQTICYCQRGCCRATVGVAVRLTEYNGCHFFCS